ncbi:MAG: translocation protein TolB [Schlesneria sp.]|nr:translocation protein TolB [Schlesneria sp.]
MDRRSIALLILVVVATGSSVSSAEVPDFNTHVLPIFRKYCNGCHNATEIEGGLVLENFSHTMKGGETGPAVVAGDSDKSRLWRLVGGLDDPKMPPKVQTAPKPDELAIIKAWIDAGAKAPAGGLAAMGLATPKIQLQARAREPITSLAVAPNGRWIARSKPHVIEIVDTANDTVIQSLTGHTGQINDISFSLDSDWLSVAAGETGLSGETTLWKTSDWTRGPVFRSHRDATYASRISPDSKLIATASYDRDVQIWEIATAKALHTLVGHNDAVYGVSFSSNSKLLATASGDRTVKLWDVTTGQRLDTFSQPAKDQYTVAFSPNSQLAVAGGVDCRLRIWQVSDTGQEGTNPILYARFAHEGPILKVTFSPDGRLLATSSEDRLVKLWETKTFTQVAVLPRQLDWPAALAFTHDNRKLLVGRMNGEVTTYPIQPGLADAETTLTRLIDSAPAPIEQANQSIVSIAEVEPNDEPSNATAMSVPGQAAGKFQSLNDASDTDLYRIEAKAGQHWIVETNAARSGSLADTKIEVLHADGRPVRHALLQAVRDSWINFRPIDSSSPDVRLEYWEEMDLNQYLYMNGEICQTYRAPQGPDSGFQLYTIKGKRRNYFDTSATAHAKDEPCYIVEAYPAESKIVENGLPVFSLNYSNDDDADRSLDKDSRLTFVAPADGTYLIKVTDVRGFGGDKHHYTLTVRSPRPDFEVTINTMNPKIPAGSGQRLKFTLNRIDRFDGDVRLDLSGLPEGFTASSPIVIPAGHLETNSVLSANSNAPEPKKEDWERVTVVATGRIGGELVTKTIGSLGEIKLEKGPQFIVTLVPDNPQFVGAEGELIIAPGMTITAKIIVERNGFDGDIKFDIDNLPHGVIVDNIGLSGVLVRTKETERQIHLIARPWVEPTSRLIHVMAQSQGNQASRPIALRVEAIAATTADK